MTQQFLPGDANEPVISEMGVGVPDRSGKSMNQRHRVDRSGIDQTLRVEAREDLRRGHLNIARAIHREPIERGGTNPSSVLQAVERTRETVMGFVTRVMVRLDAARVHSPDGMNGSGPSTPLGMNGVCSVSVLPESSVDAV